MSCCFVRQYTGCFLTHSIPLSISLCFIIRQNNFGISWLQQQRRQRRRKNNPICELLVQKKCALCKKKKKWTATTLPKVLMSWLKINAKCKNAEWRKRKDRIFFSLLCFCTFRFNYRFLIKHVILWQSTPLSHSSIVSHRISSATHNAWLTNNNNNNNKPK